LSSLKKYFHLWAARRSPRATQVVLRHKTIYVLPSKQGLGFLLVVLLIWVLGTNYQNNLILGFSFFLLSVMLVSMVHAFKNMLGLTLSPGSIHYAAVGELVPFDINLTSHYSSDNHAILLSLSESETVQANRRAGSVSQARVTFFARHRGWLKLPRITVKSYFPFGSIRAWAYVDLEHKALIFPRPIACERPPLGVGKGEEGHYFSLKRGDEFQGFQTYYPGSPLSQVAWKQYARGAGLHLKDYRSQESQQYWLDWRQVNTGDTELGLSHLCYWVNQFAEKNCEFGLLLPNGQIDMGSGEVHRLQALKALALFGWDLDE
jgi:uncharacterized protein (DUF58 family)